MIRKILPIIIFLVFNTITSGFGQCVGTNCFYAVAAGPWNNPAIWANQTGGAGGTGGDGSGTDVPGTGDDVYTNSFSVQVITASTCRNLFVEAATVNGLVLFLPLTIEGTLLGWTENFGGFPFPAPNPPAVNTIIAPFGATITFSGVSTNTAFILAKNEVIAYWNLLSPLPSSNFNFGAGVTGRISFIGTFVSFVLVPEDIAFANNLIVGDGILSVGTLETDKVNMTGVRIGAGSLTVNTGATFDLDVPLNANGTTTSTINSLVVSGTLNAKDATAYINAASVTVNAGGSLITNFNGSNQTEGWWHTTAAPSSSSFDITSTINFQANADQVIPAFSYGNLTVEAVNGVRNKTLEGTGTFIVNGTFTVNSSSVVFGSNAAASSNLDFRGDVVNFGTWGTFVNTNLRLNGTALQTISGGDPINIQNLDVIADNPAGISVTNNLDLDQNLIITSGTLTVTGANLNVAGDFTNNGGFSQTGGSTTFDGSGLQEILGTATTNFLDLTVNSDLDVESSATIAGILTLGAGVSMDADGSDGLGGLTMLSTATNTARVATLPATSSVGGDVTVQRFMAGTGGGAIFRYVSSPVTNGTASGWTSTSGVSGNPWWYDETVGGASFLGWTQTGGGLGVGQGYSLEADASGAITLALTGPLNQSNVSQSLTFTNGGGDDDVGWNLVGNPYASTVDLDNVSMGGDPNAVLSDNTSGSIQYHYYNTSTGMGTGPISGGLIASGQSFWALATAGGQSVGFTENSKTTNNGTFRRESNIIHDAMTVKLIQDAVVDEMLIGIRDGASPDYDALFDSYKRTNGIFNIASYTADNQRAAINVFGQLENGRIIKLDLYNIDPGSYSVTIEETFDQSLSFMLIDNFLEEEIPIEPTESELFTYNFEVTTDPLTFGADRFAIQVGESVITGLDDDIKNITLYPNPVNNGEALNLNIRNLFKNATSVEIAIIDRKGALLSEQSLTPGVNGSVQIDMDRYSSGVYILRVIGNNATHHYKVIKN